MLLRSIRLFAVASLLLLPAACGEEIRGDVELAPETRFPVWLYEDIGPSGVIFPGLGVRGMGFGGPILYATPGTSLSTADQFLATRIALLPEGGIAARVLASPSCLPTLFGDGVDTDGDGVPDDRTATYTPANCTVYDTATGDAYLVRGVYRIRDTNDDRYGFRLEMTDFSIRDFDGSDNSHQSSLYNLTETSTLTATGGSYRLVLEGVGTSGDATGAYGRHIRYDITQAFVPGAGTIPVGGPLPDGTLTMSGNVDISVAGLLGAARVKLTLVTTQPLIYDDGCGAITSGAHEMRLNGSSVEGINVVYSACAGHYEPLGVGVL